MELQDQIYVISGVAAGLFVLLFILLGYLMYRVAKITEALIGPQVEKRDTYAYNNPGIVHGEELNRRGFMMQKEQQSSGPSSLNRSEQPAVPSLPRIGMEFNGYNNSQQHREIDQQPPTDFSGVLNNKDIVFGGDRPSNLNQRKLPLSAPMVANDNFSFEIQHHRPQANQDPKNYHSERMQY